MLLMIPAVLLLTLLDVFSLTGGIFPAKPNHKHDLFLTLTKWVLCLNLTGP